ncbi:GIY-YIG nuclease family protein [Solimonas terrae]|uniref:GIY-YIG nuclease family protein n=1 Tax=Solimonas terrae TaxID=1396819 RepID=A0A6M2BN51_9GAMM|nr:GIY-YIG nuclease family protein [Solimonas terrae]NGY03868.1 GIY-YIG nuclease family protein [Solimonas terrae]
MNTHPQTIQIFLPSGDPQGIRIASITTRIVQVIEVPRSLLPHFLRMPEAAQVGLYFLIGESESGDRPQVYIGQTGTLAERLAAHNQKKEFWNRALVAISLTHNLTGTHAGFLEWLSIAQADKAGRYAMENGNAGSRPHTPAPLQAECTELHDTIRVLLATLGHPLFEPLARISAKADDAGLFYCRASEADARGLFTEEGFVVLKGSSGRMETVPSFQAHGYQRVRDRLLEQGVLVQRDGRVHFERDHLFASPSAAAACVTGRTANGLIEWKDAQGRTLSEVRGTPPSTGEAS